MRITITAALFVAILAAASVSGCTILSGGQSSPTPTVIYGPLPSAMPTATPTPAPDGAVANSKPSDALKIITSPLDYKVISDEKTRDGRQFENISLFVVNDGDQTAKNVMLSLDITDELTGNHLLYQEYSVGEIARGGSQAVNILTDAHQPSQFILLKITIHWGERGEYYNPAPFEMTKSFML